MIQWSIKNRILALVLSVVGLFGALTVFLVNRQGVASAEMQGLYQNDYRVASLVGQIDGLLTRVDINILRMIAIGDPASIATWKAQNADRFGLVARELGDLRASANPSMLPSINALEEAYGKMRKGMEHQVQAIEAGDIKGGGVINKNEVKDNADRTFGLLADVKSQQDLLAKNKVETQLFSAERTRIASMLASIAVGLISVFLGFLLIRSLLRPVAQAVAAAERIAAGDLSATLPTEGKDEMAQLLQALSRMQDKLGGIVEGVRGSASSVANASAEIAQGNQDLSARTEQQASALEQTASSMEQLGSAVRQNADNAKQANQLALGASTVAIKGGEVVAKVVQTMKDINGSSKQIADIISVIDGIAFQTNILALNAAVEAARAGEQGRGFAVVASEVRNLAGRSAAAAKEIKSLITASVERVEQGTALVDQAGVTMTEVVGSIRRVTDIMGEISAASSEQSAGVSQVSEAVNQMDQVTQQNAALVEESAAAAESLKGQAQQLVQAVSVFKLSRDGQASGALVTVPADRAPSLERRGPQLAKNVSRPAFGRKPAATLAPTSGSALAANGSAKTGTDDWASF